MPLRGLDRQAAEEAGGRSALARRASPSECGDVPLRVEGESMPDMQHRAVAAVRDWNARLGKDATYLICSHGDVIKAIVADSLGGRTSIRASGSRPTRAR